jgi:aminoglycoside phosphotransferase (APT) family kinase protein
LSECHNMGRTVDVKQGHAFDSARLDDYLHGTVKGYEGPSMVKQFEGGLSNFTYLLTTVKRKYVLRRKPPGKLLKSAHAVDREFRVMSGLGARGFPVPEMLVLCEDESIIGTMFYLMSYVPGRIFLNSSMPALGREERAAIYDSVNGTLARLHSFDYKALGLEDFGRPGNYFARQIARWSSQYEASKTKDIPEMERLSVWLAASIPDEGGLTGVIHGDFSFHNVLLHPTEPKVAAVLDWELSTIGDPLGDLVYHLAEWYRPVGVDQRGSLREVDLAALGIPTMEQYVARYAERTGFTLPDNLAFYRAFTLFRQAAILQGVAARARDGTANDSNAAELAAKVTPLARAAWAEALGAGAV